jgi:hypothetical protein
MKKKPKPCSTKYKLKSQTEKKIEIVLEAEKIAE